MGTIIGAIEKKGKKDYETSMDEKKKKNVQYKKEIFAGGPEPTGDVGRKGKMSVRRAQAKKNTHVVV